MKARRWFMLAALILCVDTGSLHAQSPRGATSPAGSVSGRVLVMQEGARVPAGPGVVVQLQDVPGDRPAPARAEIRQRKRKFEPELIVVPRGSIVDFPNDDKVFHNVFSLSRAARFDLGLYRSGTSKSVTMRRAGVVDVHCNIHPEMVAKIVVVDTSYYTLTRADGTFRIDGVPPGTHTLVALQARGGEHRQPVTVTAGGAAAVDIVLEELGASRRHLRKDGTPYGRYR